MTCGAGWGSGVARLHRNEAAWCPRSASSPWAASAVFHMKRDFPAHSADAPDPARWLQPLGEISVRVGRISRRLPGSDAGVALRPTCSVQLGRYWSSRARSASLVPVGERRPGDVGCPGGAGASRVGRRSVPGGHGVTAIAAVGAVVFHVKQDCSPTGRHTMLTPMAMPATCGRSRCDRRYGVGPGRDDRGVSCGLTAGRTERGDRLDPTSRYGDQASCAARPCSAVAGLAVAALPRPSIHPHHPRTAAGRLLAGPARAPRRGPPVHLLTPEAEHLPPGTNRPTFASVSARRRTPGRPPHARRARVPHRLEGNEPSLDPAQDEALPGPTTALLLPRNPVPSARTARASRAADRGRSGRSVGGGSRLHGEPRGRRRCDGVWRARGLGGADQP